jgi:N-acetylmuramoyl-L-alanine amidase
MNPTWVEICKKIGRFLLEKLSAPQGGQAISIELGSGYCNNPEKLKPAMIQHPSPNYRSTSVREISCIVIHSTATDGLSSPLNWLCDPRSKVSAHFLIHKDGTIYQLVREDDVAYHAGVSEWAGRSSVNEFSIGIELVNRNTGYDPYPKEQVFACAKLVKYLCETHSIGIENIVSHEQVAPGRKNDPLGFDWDAFREVLALA